MEFKWTEEHIQFRRKLRSALDELLPADWPVFSKGYDNGSDSVVAFSKSFCPELARRGLLIPHWPTRYGGGGLDAYYHWILGEEMWRNGEPRAYQYMSVNWVGPAILNFGTERQKDFHIPRICEGTISYCQGFSEPNAGSDLAALSTKATPVPGGYRINGQKIWTSAASFADYCVLLARTGGERTQGISVFLVPMDSPGIEVRIIPSLQGQRSLHEVFFNDVEIDASAILGPENGGWNIVRHILSHERVGAPGYALIWRGFSRALELLRQRGRFSGEAVRMRAAQCEAALAAGRLMTLRTVDRRAKGEELDETVNFAKYDGAEAARMVGEFLTDYAPDLILEDPLIGVVFRRGASAGIVAGATEVQLDLIARRVLNLPRGN